MCSFRRTGDTTVRQKGRKKIRFGREKLRSAGVTVRQRKSPKTSDMPRGLKSGTTKSAPA